MLAKKWLIKKILFFCILQLDGILYELKYTLMHIKWSVSFDCLAVFKLESGEMVWSVQ